uniref:Uncharacterized protein n=1 Tax=Rhizophora mucronata TaxID=61149 RepID=A0A2P2P1M9_RHIMU
MLIPNSYQTLANCSTKFRKEMPAVGSCSSGLILDVGITMKLWMSSLKC